MRSPKINGNEEFNPKCVDRDRLAAASTTQPHVVISATDPYAPADPRGWSTALDLDCDLLPDAGHITPQDGYGPWPAALAWCLHRQTPVVMNTDKDDPLRPRGQLG